MFAFITSRRVLWWQCIPVLLDVQRSVAFECQHVPRGKLLNVAKERRGRRSRQESQIVIKRLLVDVRRDGWMLQYRFDLGRKNEASVLVVEVERFDADAIANQH